MFNALIICKLLSVHILHTNAFPHRLTDDVCIDLHLSVLLRQLESFIVALRQNQEVDGRAIVVQPQEEPETQQHIVLDLLLKYKRIAQKKFIGINFQ